MAELSSRSAVSKSLASLSSAGRTVVESDDRNHRDGKPIDFDGEIAVADLEESPLDESLGAGQQEAARKCEPGDSEDYFSRIPFEKVFHEGSIGGDRSIIEHRCAEVLAPSPLPLANHLQWVFCRTAAERDTLLCLLGSSHPRWRVEANPPNGNYLVQIDLEGHLAFKDYLTLGERLV